MSYSDLSSTFFKIVSVLVLNFVSQTNVLFSKMLRPAGIAVPNYYEIKNRLSYSSWKKARNKKLSNSISNVLCY